MSFLLALPMLAAAPFADPAAIDMAIAGFTGAEAGAPGGATVPTDRRLRLAPCPVPLALDWYGSTRQTVLVRCPLPGGWRLFVPIRAGGETARAAPAVLRGDAVTIVVSGEGFAVSRSGESLEAAPAGGWVRVRPADARAGETLRAQVLRPGVVGIALP